MHIHYAYSRPSRPLLSFSLIFFIAFSLTIHQFSFFSLVTYTLQSSFYCTAPVHTFHTIHLHTYIRPSAGAFLCLCVRLVVYLFVRPLFAIASCSMVLCAHLLLLSLMFVEVVGILGGFFRDFGEGGDFERQSSDFWDFFRDFGDFRDFSVFRLMGSFLGFL